MKKKKINESTQLFIDKILDLLNKKVSKEILLDITNSSSKRQVRKIIYNLTEHHDLLKKNDIKIYSDKKKKKKKISLKGSQFDRTTSSVKTIYTPMGNKR